MKKLFSFVLTLLLVSSIISVAFVPVGALENVIYIDTKGWTGFSKLYCHIWENNGASFYNWGDSSTLCKKLSDNLYYFDLVKLEKSTMLDGGLREGESYLLNIHTNAVDGGDTYYLSHDITLDRTCADDKIVITGNTFENPVNSQSVVYEINWTENKENFGPHFAITSSGEFIGKYLCANEDGTKTVAHWISNYYNSTVCDPVSVVAKLLRKFKIYDVDDISRHLPDYKVSEEEFDIIYAMLEKAYDIAYNVEVLEQYGNFKYRVLSDGTAEIAEYVGVEAYVEVPSMVADKTVSSIGYYSFGECGYIKEIIIPESVNTIKDYAFEDCYGIKNIQFHSKIKSIGEGIFKNCRGLSEINVAEENPYYKSVDGVLYNKDVTELIAFPADCVAEYEFPETVTSIAKLGFYGCAGLEKVVMTDNIKTIGYAAFFNCTALETIEMSAGIESISLNVFVNTKWFDLQNHGVIFIGDIIYTYKNKTPSSTSAPHSVIDSSGKLVIKGDATSIADNAFAFVHSLKSVTIPASVKTIGMSAFYGCKNLDNVNIPEGVETIEQGAFEECKKLQKVKLPKSLKSIGPRAFGFYLVHDAIKGDLYKRVSYFTVYGYEKSVAQTYAKNSKLQFINVLKMPKIKLTKKSLKAGKTFTNKVYNADGVKVDWVTSNKRIATVDKKGVISAVTSGPVTITAKVRGYKDIKCKVRVTSSPKITKNKKNVRILKIKKGKTVKVSLSGKLSAVKNKYKSGNKKVAKIISGKNATKLKIKGYKKGTIKMHVTVNKTYKITFTVIVK